MLYLVKTLLSDERVFGQGNPNQLLACKRSSLRQQMCLLKSTSFTEIRFWDIQSLP